MSKNKVDKELINYLDALYKESDDVSSNERATLNQEKPFTVL